MKEIKSKQLLDYATFGLQAKNHNGEIIDLNVRNTLSHLSGAIGMRPILHPMSDINKKIKYNGEEFIPLGKLHYLFVLTASGKRNTKAQYECHVDNNSAYTRRKGSMYEDFTFGCIKIDFINIGKNEHRIMQKLLRWGFDIYGLIDDNLAVDINKMTLQNTE